MSEYSNGNGVWNGWHWRFLTILVLAICGLELLAYKTMKYPMITSVTLGVLIVIYVAIPRLKERRLAHSLIGVVAVVIITSALEAYFEPDLFQNGVNAFLLYNGLALLIGIGMSFAYLKITDWSNAKRVQMEAKRRDQPGTTTPVQPQRRHSRGKKKKNKKHR